MTKQSNYLIISCAFRLTVIGTSSTLVFTVCLVALTLTRAASLSSLINNDQLDSNELNLEENKPERNKMKNTATNKNVELLESSVLETMWAIGVGVFSGQLVT